MDLKSAIFLTLVAGAFSGPLNLRSDIGDDSRCSRTCAVTSKFNYEQGRIYEFSYKGKSLTSVHGASEDQSVIEISTNAHIEIISKCELALKLTNTVLKGSDPSAPSNVRTHSESPAFKRSIERYTLRFSFQDGIIQEICPHTEESVWVLNFKRGILSAFQNGMDTFDQQIKETKEIDISGHCPTSYKIAQEGWRSNTIKKTKDLDSCTDRLSFDSIAKSILYKVPSAVQSLPLMKSSYECDQVISTSGILESSTCHEFLLFRPFSKERSGALTEITQTLTATGVSYARSPSTAPFGSRRTLIFEHVDGEQSESSSDIQPAVDKLTELCQSIDSDVKPNTPSLFAELVHQLKRLDADSLDILFNRVKKRSFCRGNTERIKKFYMDAIPMVGTGAAVRQITRKIISNDVTGVFAEMWLASLSFVQHPSKDMLLEIRKLLDMPESNKVILPVSSLVHTYCSNNPSCQTDAEVTAIVSWFEGKLGQSCTATNNNYMQILLSLRAIGNIGLVEDVVPVFEECFTLNSNPMEIRIAAVEAYRRLSCGADRNNLMTLYRDATQDSELRISAYIQVMKCPTQWTIDNVKEQLESETVNQVGSFVWTHLTNLMETSDPNKQDVRAILEDEKLRKEFDLDRRKFSRNYEISHFSESMNLGGNVESNLVWSPKSFVPRSLMANLTVDLFGHSFNLLEIGGRVEGLEHLLESYFGSAGYFPENSETSTPNNRHVNMNKLNKIHSKLEVPEEEVKGSLYMRVFGNEVKYLNLQNLDGAATENKFNFKSLFAKLAKDGDVSYSYSNMFLDSTVIIPTAIGLPLNLTVNGTMSLDIRGTGKINIKAPANLVLVEGNVNPSGAIEISSMMSVDAFVTKGGMKMVSTLHSSSAMQGKIEFSQKQALVVELNFPKEQSEVFSAKTSFFLVQGHQEKEQNMGSENKIRTSFCTGRTLAKVTGLELCSQISLTNSTFSSESPEMPLSGPASMDLKLYNRDLPNGYKFEFKKIMTNDQSLILLSYDTPGSRTTRLMSFNANVRHVQKTVNIDMISPWKKAVFTGNLVNRDDMKSVEGTLVVDDDRTYRSLFKLRRQKSGPAIIYTPNILVSIHDKDPYKLTGSLVYRKNKNVVTKLAITGVTQDPITLNATVKFTAIEKSLLVQFSHKKGEVYSEDFKFQQKKGKNNIDVYALTAITKSPKKVLSIIKGRSYVRANQSIKFDLNIQKMTSLPIKFKGLVLAQTKKQASFYKGRLRYNGPKKTMFLLKVDADKRPDAVTGTAKFNYNLIKVDKMAKDSMLMTWKLIRRIRTIRTVELITNFRSQRYGEYNNKMNVKASQRPGKFGEVNFVLNHGRSYMDKNNKRRLTVHGESRYQVKGNTNKLDYAGHIEYPIERFHVALSGDHFNNKRIVNSSINLDYKRKRIMDTFVYFTDLSRNNLFNYNAGASIVAKARHIKVDGSVSRPNADTYTGSMSVQHQRDRVSRIRATYKALSSITHELSSTVELYNGQTTSVNSVFSQPTNTSYQMSTNLQLYDGKSFTGRASLDTNTANPMGSVTFAYNDNNYTMTVSGENHRSYRKLASVIRYPTRHIVFEMGGGKKDEKYEGIFDVQWDVENQVTDSRVMLEVTYKNGGVQDFEASAKFKIPKHLYAATVRHISTDRYNTFVQVAWNPEDKIEIEVLFHDNKRRFKRTIDAKAGLKTPFEHFEDLNGVVEYSNSRKYFASGFSVTYARDHTVGFSVGIKKPFSLNYLDLEVSLKTPHPEVGNPVFRISQLMTENFSTHTGSTSLTWGQNQFVNIDTNGEFSSAARRRRWTRNIGVTSSLKGYETITLNVTHQDNSRKFKSNAIYTVNDRTLLYDIDTSLIVKGFQIQSNGTLNITSPYDNLNIDWSHVNTDRDVRSSVVMLWSKGQRLAADFTGSVQLEPTRRIVADFKAEIPHPDLRRLSATFEHNDHPGNARTSGKIRADRKNIGTLNMNYVRGISNVDYDLFISSKYMETFRTTLNTRNVGGIQHTGEMEVQWAPTKKINVDASMTYDGQKTFYSTATVTTPFQKASRIVFTGAHGLKGLEWVGEVGIDYAPRQKIEIETKYRFDTIKLGRIKLMTPFPHFQQVDTGIEISGLELSNPFNNIQMTADYQMIPYVPREQIRAEIMSRASTKDELRRALARGMNRADVENLIESRIRGLLEYKNPIVTIAKVELSSKLLAGKRSSKVVLEFLDKTTMEKRKLQLDGESTMNEVTGFDGNFKFRSPYTSDIIVVYRHKGDIQNLQNHWEVTYQGNRRIVGDFMYGNNPDLHGKLILKTPYAGSEKVEVGFRHHGTEWKDFSTEVIYGTNSDKVEVETTLNVPQKRGKFMIKTPFPKLLILQTAAQHTDNDNGFSNHAEFIYNEHVLLSNNSISHKDDETIGEMVLKTPHSEANDLLLKFHRQGVLNNFQFALDAKRNREELECNTIFRHDDDYTSLTLTTKNNIQGLDDVGVALIRDGPWNSATVSSTLMKGDVTIRSQGDFIHSNAATSLRASMSGNPEWLKDMSVDFAREGLLPNIKSTGHFIYDSIKHEYDMKLFHTEDTTNSHITLKSPKLPSDILKIVFKRSGGSIENMETTTEILDGSSSTVSKTEFSHTGSSTVAKYSLTSDHSAVKGMSANFKHITTSTDETVELSATYDQDNFNFIYGLSRKADKSFSRSMQFTTTLDTVEDMKIVVTRQSTEEVLKVTALGSYGTKEISSDLDVHITERRINFVVNNNFLEKKKIDVQLRGEGTIQDYKTYSQIAVDDDTAETTFHFTHTKSTTTGELTVTTTVDTVDDLSVVFKRKGGVKDFTALTEIKYGTKTITTNLHSKVSGMDVVIIGSFVSPYTEDFSFTIDQNTKKRGFINNVRSSYGSKNSINWNTNCKVKKNDFTFESILSATVDGKKKIGQVEISHKGDDKNFIFKKSISWTKIRTNTVVTVDVRDFENLSVTAQTDILSLVIDSSRFGDLQMGVTNTKAGTMYTTKFFITDIVTVTSNLDYKSPRKIFKLIGTSTFKGYEDLHLEFTHSGSSKNFRTVGTLTATPISEVATELNFSITDDMDINSTFKFNHGEIDVLSLLIAQQQHYEFVTNFKFDAERKIELSSSYKKEMNRRPRSEVQTFSVDLKTPFERVQTLEISSYSKMMISQFDRIPPFWKSMEHYKLNGKNLWSRTMDIEKTANRLEMSYVVTSDISPEYRFSLQRNAQNEYTYNGNINWNKENPNSNLDLQGTASYDTLEDADNKFEAVSQAEMDMRIIHHTRTVGMKGSYRKKEPLPHTSLEITMDEAAGRKIGYELGWHKLENNEKEQFVKIITPLRMVEVLGSVTPGSPKVSEYSLFWDATGDRSQRAVLRMEHGNNYASNRATIFIDTSGGNREYSVHHQFWKNRGISLFESRTDISLTNDDSKDIVFTAKLDDNSQGSNKNHSLFFGITQTFGNIDTSLTAHYASGDDRCSAGVSMETLTANAQRKNLLLMAEINKLRKEVNLMVVGPVKSVGLSGVVKSETPFKAVVTSTYDAQGLINSEIKYNKKKKMVEIRTAYDRENPASIVHLKAAYPDRLHLEVEAFRTGAFPRVSDSLLTMHLKSSRLLHTKLQWRPELFEELMTYSSELMEKYSDEVSSALQQMANEFGDEVLHKFDVINTQVQTEFAGPVSERLSSQLDLIQAQIRKLNKKIDKWTDKQDFVLEKYSNAIRIMRAYKAKITLEMKQSVLEMKQKILEPINYLKNHPMEQNFKEAVNELSEKILECRQSVEEFILREKEQVATKVAEALQKFRDILNKLTNELQEDITELMDEISQHPQVQEIRNNVNAVLETLPAAPSLPDIDLKTHLKKVHKVLKTGIENLNLNESKMVMENMKAYLTAIKNDPDVREIHRMILEIYKKMVWLVGDWDIKASIDEFATDLYNSSREFLMEDIGKLKIIHWDKQRLIAFDPENGLIEFEIYLPTKMNTLERLPKFNYKKYLERLTVVWDEYIPMLKDLSVWDIYYRYKPSLNPDDWVPPFSAYAVVSGNRHFITFDKRHFDFMGMCSFVLARDIHDNNFTVIVNYNRNRRNPKIKSLLIMVEGKSVELFPDFTIKVDNTQTELPFLHKRLYVKREGNIVVLDSGTGLTVSGDMQHENFIVELSGWYFGRVTGLLGTYDNEQYDDMTMSTGVVTNNVNDFVSSWEISKRCNAPGNIASNVNSSEDAPGYSQCTELFKSNDSPLRPCFKVVDPASYMGVCLTSMQVTNGNTCKSAALYIKMCQMSGVKIWLPQQCITCQTPSSEIYNAGEAITLSPASDEFQVPKSADVVFVVERRQCNQRVANKLGDLVYELEKSLSGSSISNNKYGLISFGAKGPLSHTIEGQLLNDARKFAKGAESLVYDEDTADSLQAIMSAANYPFRTGVSKTIVLVECDRCDNSDINMYNHLKHVLQTRDITLHILRDQGFRLGNSPPKDKIIGIDNLQKYFLSPPKDASIYNQLIIPDDSCASLALASNGSLYDSTSIRSSHVRNRKKAIKLMSKRLSDSASPHECQVCHCVSDATGAAKSVCRKCYSSISDYLPQMWSHLKHPQVLQDQFERQLKEYLEMS